MIQNSNHSDFHVQTSSKPEITMQTQYLGSQSTQFLRKNTSPPQVTWGVVYWFRNDLRLHDNPALQQAIALAKRQHTWLLPVFVQDTALQLTSPWGFVRTSAHRLAWTAMAVHDVAQQLTALGSQLLQISGDPSEVLAELMTRLSASTLVCEDIAAPYEQTHIHTLKKRGLDVQTVWQSTLMAPEQLPFAPQDVPDAFSGFRRAVERQTFAPATPAPAITHMPALPELASDALTTHPPLASAGALLNDPRSAFPWSQPAFHGGERAALAHLSNYCERGLPHSYKATRNGLYGADYSTKWSPWLATGALSARQAWAAIQSFEAQQGATDSTYWIGFELLWRDHFRWLHLKYGERMYWQRGLSNAPMQQGGHNARGFERWRTAQTGHALIDAGMRELNSTGYSSNRLRQNLASFLIHDLRCDWRAGAAWFESQLIDFDVYNNQGNWLYLSGRGTDPRGSRRFNPDKQANDYDADGTYRKLWL
jgi:deoxyribodipyrimidine photo-lyase